MVTVVQEEEKLTAKVPRVLLSDLTVKLAEPPPERVFDVGDIWILLGPDVVMV